MPAWIDSMRIRLYLPFMNRLYADELYALDRADHHGWSINSTNESEAGRNDGRTLIPWLLAGIPCWGCWPPALQIGSRAG